MVTTGLNALPDPPYDPDVSLGGFDRIDMPIDWLGEDWALDLDDSTLGCMFRLLQASLRQSPAGSLPGDLSRVMRLAGIEAGGPAFHRAMVLWPTHADNRRYWARLVPVIEEAWGRKKGRVTKEGLRKRRERLAAQLVKAGLTEIGAASHDVQDVVFAELGDQRMTEENVLQAAMRAGVVGPVKAFNPATVRGVS